MIFSSITFLYYFLPFALILYFAVPYKLKNTALLLLSLIFYAWGEPRYVLLMTLSIICGYVFGILIERFRDGKLSKLFATVSIAISLSFLLFFKYCDFFIDNFNMLTGSSLSFLRLALPIGISFYTFQIISYTADIYRKKTKAQKNIINLAVYISLFPQLIAGPIVRYTDIEVQLIKRTHTLQKISSGIRLFVIGLSKKILIANALGELCGVYHASQEKSLLFCWIYAIAYALQVYFDFSGYSDMAIGLGRIFGFNFCKNFNYPYISESISEFWRRWHISLGSWFKDYVYIPLGGNRVSNFKHIRNILIVWALTGFWHGASWNFIIWGLYFSIFLIAEKFLFKDFLKNHKIIGHVYVFIVVLISFVIFSFTNMKDAVACIYGMFLFVKEPIITSEHMYYIRSFIGVLFIAIAGAFPILPTIYEKLKQTNYGSKVLVIAEPVGLVFLILLCTSYLVDGSFNPFLYFRF